MAAGDIPESVYRNTLDLNRFSTGTARKLVRQYDRIINDAIAKLAKIEAMPRAKQPKYKADRLRSLLKQLKTSLDGWSDKSAAEMVKDLNGIAKLQSEFAELQLAKALPTGSNAVINPINVTKSYAEAVVKSKPIDLNASLLSDDLQAKVKGVPEKFSLTSKQGSLVNLPNGEPLLQNFRALAAKQAELFGRTVRDGMLTGETTPQIARQLRNQLIFEDGKQMRPNQVTTLVRTSVQQVSNDAAQSVYEANQDISSEYRWIATLDSKTAPQCRVLDQQVFKYGEGPTPPQHFNCRCRTVAVLDNKKLGISKELAERKLGQRSAEGGAVKAGTSYGKFLSEQSASYKAKALGKTKVKYFNTLSKKYGPDQALRKMVRTDGQSKTLKQLQKTYGKTPTSLKKSKPASKAIKPSVKTGLTASKDKELKKLLKDMGVDPKSITSLTKTIKETTKDKKPTLIKATKAEKIPSKAAAKKAEKLALEGPKPKVPRAPLKAWDDKSFIQSNIATTDKKTPPPPRKSVKNGKKSTKDLFYSPERRNAMKDYDLTGAQFDSTKEKVGEWTGSNYRDIRGVQIKQAKLAGKQLNPGEARQLRSFDMRFEKEQGIINATARDADKMENYIAKTPKWKGKPRDVRFGDTYYDNQPDGTIFRGMTVNNKNIVEEVIENLQKGEAVTTMESWSTDPRTAMRFAKGEIGSGNHGIMLRHVNKHGVPIEYLNGTGESEILQPSGVRYKVVNVSKKNWTETVKWEGGEELQDHSMTEIILEAI
jgi:SPP1 gp7 family putative phage head morphogenesis protein